MGRFTFLKKPNKKSYQAAKMSSFDSAETLSSQNGKSTNVDANIKMEDLRDQIIINEETQNVGCKDRGCHLNNNSLNTRARKSLKDRYLKELIETEEANIHMLWVEVENVLDEIHAISPTLHQAQQDFRIRNNIQS